MLVGLCACGGGSGRSAPRVTSPKALLRVTVVTTGAVSESATYTVTTGPQGAASCAAAAETGNSSPRQFTVRGPGSRVAPLYFEFRTIAYHGPAKYEQRAVKFDSVLAMVGGKSVYFERAPDSRVSMTVDQDGSGTASFASFVSSDGRSLNGVATWRCETSPVAA